MPQRPFRIVVGIDGSEPSRRALRWAVSEALKWDADLTVVHAWRFGSSPTDPLVPQDAIRRVGAAAQHLLDDEVAFAREAGAEAAGSLVFASRGRGAVGAALLGSVSQACVRRARCPVVVVPDTTTVAEPPARAHAVPVET